LGDKERGFPQRDGNAKGCVLFILKRKNIKTKMIIISEGFIGPATIAKQ